MKLKSTMAVLTALFMLAGFQATAYNIQEQNMVTKDIEKKIVTKEDLEKTKSKKDTAILKDKPEVAYKLKKGSVVVRVKTMCDKKYRRQYKDWKVRAKQITQEATQSLYSKFNIKFTVKKAVSATMLNNNNPDKILAKFTKKYKVKGKCDMIVGFSGNSPFYRIRGKEQYIAGIAYMGKTTGGPRPIVFSGTYDSEVETTQHEIAHTYGLNHCNNHCVMTSAGFGYLNRFCSAHSKQWYKNRKYYKK